MLLTPFSGVAFGIGLRAAIMARGQRLWAIMAAQKVNTKVIPQQATTYLFISVLLGLNLTLGCNCAIMEFTRPLRAVLHPS